MSRMAVETWDLSKTFHAVRPDENLSWGDAVAKGVQAVFRPPKKKTVLDRVGLKVGGGEFFGIIGSNGAGKTTLLKILACLLYPDGGGARVNGFDVVRERNSVRRSVVIAKAGGWLGTLWQLTGRENLLFRARLCGLHSAEAVRRTEYILDRLEIANKAEEHSWNWSAGECQKFSLAMTFIARTPVVILDEPTSHLDPRTSRLVREFAKDELNRRNGQTVVMSTHYLDEADLLCDRVAVLHAGKILACDTPALLKRAHCPGRILELRTASYSSAAGERSARKCGVHDLLVHFEDISAGQARIRPKWTDPAASPDAFIRELQSEGVSVVAVRRLESSLDDVYFRLAGEKAT